MAPSRSDVARKAASMVAGTSLLLVHCVQKQAAFVPSSMAQPTYTIARSTHTGATTMSADIVTPMAQFSKQAPFTSAQRGFCAAAVALMVSGCLHVMRGASGRNCATARRRRHFRSGFSQCQAIAESSANAESDGGAADATEEEIPVAAAVTAACVVFSALAAVDPAFAEATGGNPAVDAAVIAAETATTASEQSGGDWFDPIVNFNAGLIAGLDDVIEENLKVTNTFGFAIIFYTMLIKLVTYPLNQTALRAGALMQLIAPKVKMIQTRYKNDQETQNRMLLRLYDDCGINPIGGCLPTIIQLPIFLSLYRAINKLAEKNPHFQEPFLWIPSLAGPAEVGKPSLDWLLKSKSADAFEPLIGWNSAGLYLILPVMLVASQVFTQRASAPPPQPGGNNPLAAITNFFPLIIGYTTLVSPSGLGLYWFMNNLLTTAQTTLIKNGIANEFPEYKDMLEGKKDDDDTDKEKEEATEEEESTTGVGFGMAPPEEPLMKQEPVAEEGEKTKVPVTKAKTIKQAEENYKAARDRRDKRKSGRRKRR